MEFDRLLQGVEARRRGGWRRRIGVVERALALRDLCDGVAERTTRRRRAAAQALFERGRADSAHARRSGGGRLRGLRDAFARFLVKTPRNVGEPLVEAVQRMFEIGGAVFARQPFEPRFEPRQRAADRPRIRRWLFVQLAFDAAEPLGERREASVGFVPAVIALQNSHDIVQRAGGFALALFGARRKRGDDAFDGFLVLPLLLRFGRAPVTLAAPWRLIARLRLVAPAATFAAERLTASSESPRGGFDPFFFVRVVVIRIAGVQPDDVVEPVSETFSRTPRRRARRFARFEIQTPLMTGMRLGHVAIRRVRPVEKGTKTKWNRRGRANRAIRPATGADGRDFPSIKVNKPLRPAP